MSIRSQLILTLFLMPTTLVAQNMDMGHAYEELETDAVRVTTDFGAYLAVSERDSSGELTTQLLSKDDQRLMLTLVAKTSGSLEIDLAPALGRALSLRETYPFASYSADLANYQLYLTWLETQRSLPQLERHPEGALDCYWQSGILRMGTAREPLQGFDSEAIHKKIRIETVTTEFPALTAKGERRVIPNPDGVSLEPYVLLTTRLFDNITGKELGLAQWYTQEEIFAWDIYGLTSGWLSDSRVPGGIRFDINLAWTNVQAYGFWKYKTLSASDYENTEGCDGLHWLDNTIFRDCCDQHDACYEREDPNCTYHSWWFNGSWSCIKCNLQAIWCFATVWLPGSGSGTGGGGAHGQCVVQLGSLCPASCASCVYFPC